MILKTVGGWAATHYRVVGGGSRISSGVNTEASVPPVAHRIKERKLGETFLGNPPKVSNIIRKNIKDTGISTQLEHCHARVFTRAYV